MELIKCSRCVIPETHETIHFDENGVCNVCRQSEFKKENIDWASREKELVELLDAYRGKGDYDCLVPFSGGKDSTFTLLTLVRKYKLKPLVISFDHGFYRPTVEESKTRTFRKLGVDVLRFTPNWQLVKKLMLESMKRKGDFCWHCHTGIFAYPMQVAIRYKVPLVIWGEPSAEYTSYYSYDDGIEEVDEERFNRFVNLGINAEDMVGMLNDSDITMREMQPFVYPPLRELKAINYRSFCLGSYIPWDVKRQSQLIKDELGWQEEEVEGVPPGYGYEKIECCFQGVRDYLKYIKRGYARTSHLVSIDIRNGRMDREEAARLVEEYEGRRPASLDVFLDYLGISEAEFNEIAVSQLVHPNQCDPAALPRGQELWDQRIWYHENMPGMGIKELMHRYDELQKENELKSIKTKDKLTVVK